MREKKRYLRRHSRVHHPPLRHRAHVRLHNQAGGICHSRGLHHGLPPALRGICFVRAYAGYRRCGGPGSHGRCTDGIGGASGIHHGILAGSDSSRDDSLSRSRRIRPCMQCNRRRSNRTDNRQNLRKENSIRIMTTRKFTRALLLFLLTPALAQAAPMKAHIIQQRWAPDRQSLDKSFEWTIAQLRACDESMDIIVLPEFSNVPGETLSREDFLATSARNCPVLMEECAATAKRCNSLVFCGTIDTSTDPARNTIMVYGRDGALLGKYCKQHLTRGEWSKLDMSYTQEWSRPWYIDIEGVRYMFLICYDFYFYENYSNLARWKPDVIIGCSLQRSDTFRAHDIINSFLAYNTGAYLVRAAVSMGAESEVGGCSCVIAPTGEILASLRNEVSTLDATFDPSVKYRKPAGYGNPPALHCEYIEIGRRPWKYRPGGSAIVPPIDETPAQHSFARFRKRGDRLLAAIGKAIALDTREVAFNLRTEDLGTLERILRKFSCHAIMQIRLKGSWTEDQLQQVKDMVFDYDAQGHVYFVCP